MDVFPKSGLLQLFIFLIAQIKEEVLPLLGFAAVRNAAAATLNLGLRVITFGFRSIRVGFNGLKQKGIIASPMTF